MFRRLVWTLFAIVFFIGLAGLAYDLPRTQKVHITGTDIKRSDKTAKDGTKTTQDVRYVYAEAVDNKGVLAFRNEDTGFSWPPYFKFNSGDVAAAASAMESEEPRPIVLVKYYGVRSNVLSIYPNVISLRKVDASYERLPWFNALIYVLYVFLFIFFAVLVRRFLRWRPFGGKAADEAEEPGAQPEAEATEEP